MIEQRTFNKIENRVYLHKKDKLLNHVFIEICLCCDNQNYYPDKDYNNEIYKLTRIINKVMGQMRQLNYLQSQEKSNA